MTLNGPLRWLHVHNLSLCFSHNNAISAAFPFLDHKSWFFCCCLLLRSIPIRLFVMMFGKQNYGRWWWYWTQRQICVTIIVLLPSGSKRRQQKPNIKRNQKFSFSFFSQSKCWRRGRVWSVRPEILKWNRTIIISKQSSFADVAKQFRNKILRW